MVLSEATTDEEEEEEEEEKEGVQEETRLDASLPVAGDFLRLVTRREVAWLARATTNEGSEQGLEQDEEDEELEEEEEEEAFFRFPLLAVTSSPLEVSTVLETDLAMKLSVLRCPSAITSPCGHAAIT